MSDMWFSICNKKMYIIKDGLIRVKLKNSQTRWNCVEAGGIFLIQHANKTWFSVVFSSHSVLHPQWPCLGFFNFVIINNCFCELSLGPASTDWWEAKWRTIPSEPSRQVRRLPKIHSSSGIAKQRNCWLINITSYDYSLVLEENNHSPAYRRHSARQSNLKVLIIWTSVLEAKPHKQHPCPFLFFLCFS